MSETVSADRLKEIIRVMLDNYGRGIFRRDAEDMIFWRVMMKAPKTKHARIDAIKQAALAERVSIHIEPTLYRRFEGANV